MKFTNSLICLAFFCITLGLLYLKDRDNTHAIEQEIEKIVEEPKENLEKPENQLVNPTSYQEALVLAKNTNKKVLLMISARGCRPCQDMKTVLKDESLKSMLEKDFIVFVSEDDRVIRSKFHVLGTPTMVVLDKNEAILSKTVGYMSAERFGKWLKNSIKDSKFDLVIFEIANS